MNIGCTTTKARTPSSRTIDRGIAGGHHFLKKVQLQQKGIGIINLVYSIIADIPLVVGEPGNGPPKLGSNYGKSVLNVITVLMKSSSPEVVLGCSEQQFKLFGVTQGVMHEQVLLGG